MSKELEWIGTYPLEKAEQLAAELQRQKESRRDYIYPVAKLSVDEDGSLCFGSTDTFRVGNRVYTEWPDAEKAADETKQKLEPLGKTGKLVLSPTAEQQLANRLGIPMRYVTSLREKGNKDLAAVNFNTLIGRDERKVLVRTLDGRVRAMLSDSYKVLDNGDLFFAAADTFGEVGADLWQARLWEDKFELLAVSPHIRGEVTTDRTFDPGDGWQSRWHGEGGDAHNAAVRISNSETGEGGLKVQPAVMRKVCANFNVWGNVLNTIHLGKRMSEEGLLRHMGIDVGDQVFSEKTREAESQVVWMKVKEVIKTAFSPEAFKAYIDKLNGATQQVLQKPEKAVENVVREYSLGDARKHAILSRLMKSGDRSRYGLIQAVTYEAHEADAEGRPDEASTLESIGGDLLGMADSRFAAIAG